VADEEPQRPEPSAIVRIVEVPAPDWTYSDRTRRMLALFRAGIPEYWSVDEENMTIWVFRAGWARSPGGDALPEDFDRTVAEWFGSGTSPTSATSPVPGEGLSMREQLLDFLRREPFRPFWIFLRDGEAYPVERPPQVMLLGPARILLGIPSRDEPWPAVSETVHLVMENVERVAYVER